MMNLHYLFSLALRWYWNWFWFWFWCWTVRCSEWAGRPSTSLPTSPASPTDRSLWSEGSCSWRKSSCSSQLTSWGRWSDYKTDWTGFNACRYLIWLKRRPTLLFLGELGSTAADISSNDTYRARRGSTHLQQSIWAEGDVWVSNSHSHTQESECKRNRTLTLNLRCFGVFFMEFWSRSWWWLELNVLWAVDQRGGYL